MDIKKEKTVALYIAIICLVLGIVSYAAFPQRKPEEPVRIWFQSSAGNVLFDMKEHASEDGYGIDCTTCHHAYDPSGEEKPGACVSIDCHGGEDEEAPKPEDAFHKLCTGCHEEDGTAPVECAKCHAL